MKCYCLACFWLLGLLPSLGMAQGYVNTDSLERLVWQGFNEARTAVGLPPAERHPLLDDLARYHSENMKTHKFLGHVDHNQEDPQQRKDYDFPELIGHVGEQVAFVYGPGLEAMAEAALSEWLYKRKDRKLTLNPAFNYVGVGAVQDLDGVYVTLSLGSLYAELVTELPPDTVAANSQLLLIYRYLGRQPRNEMAALLLHPYPDAKKGKQFVGVQKITPDWLDGYFRLTLSCDKGPGRYSFLFGPTNEMAPGGIVVEVPK